MSIIFHLYQEVNLEEARNLLLYSTDKYLSNINSNEEIRPYLNNYPFTEENTEITIFFYNPDRSNLPQENIYCASSEDGKVFFYSRSLGLYRPLHEETYEEAKSLVLD